MKAIMISIQPQWVEKISMARKLLKSEKQYQNVNCLAKFIFIAQKTQEKYWLVHLLWKNLGLVGIDKVGVHKKRKIVATANIMVKWWRNLH